MHPKYIVHLDKKYLEFIRTKDCLVCAEPSPSQAHHVWNSGRKKSGNDFLAIPLCVKCHTFGTHAYHVIEHNEFERVHNVDLSLEIINLLTEYLDNK